VQEEGPVPRAQRCRPGSGWMPRDSMQHQIKHTIREGGDVIGGWELGNGAVAPSPQLVSVPSDRVL
jgi:hypothetical protein